MNTVKKIFGFVWIFLALLCAYYGLFYFGLPKITHAKGTDDLVFGFIILGVLMPIIVGGMLFFGWYAIKGEYNKQS